MIRIGFRLVCALSVAAAMACSDNAVAPTETSGLGHRLQVWIPDSEAVLANEGVSGFASATRIVVADTVTWRALWQVMYAHRVPQPPLPAISFASQSVVVVGLGDRYASLQLDSITRFDAGDAAFLTQTVPGSNCVVLGVVLTPAIAVSVPATLVVQVWSLRTVTHYCS
jgi:hypothetical protein